jgi:hypothetical protein
MMRRIIWICLIMLSSLSVSSEDINRKESDSKCIVLDEKLEQKFIDIIGADNINMNCYGYFAHDLKKREIAFFFHNTGGNQDCITNMKLNNSRCLQLDGNAIKLFSFSDYFINSEIYLGDCVISTSPVPYPYVSIVVEMNARGKYGKFLRSEWHR